MRRSTCCWCAGCSQRGCWPRRPARWSCWDCSPPWVRRSSACDGDQTSSMPTPVVLQFQPTSLTCAAQDLPFVQTVRASQQYLAMPVAERRSRQCCHGRSSAAGPAYQCRARRAAPLSAAAVDALVAAAGTTDVELDLSTGQRGRRGRATIDALLAAVPSAAAAHVVNNGAAALVLAATLAAGVRSSSPGARWWRSATGSGCPSFWYPPELASLRSAPPTGSPG